MLTDVIIGFSILAIIVTVVTMAWRKQQEGLSILAERRAIVQVAEGALSALQAGQTEHEEFIAAHPNTNVTFVRVSDASAPEGFQWARVIVKRDEREVSLLGLVPRDRLPEGE